MEWLLTCLMVTKIAEFIYLSSYLTETLLAKLWICIGQICKDTMTSFGCLLEMDCFRLNHPTSHLPISLKQTGGYFLFDKSSRVVNYMKDLNFFCGKSSLEASPQGKCQHPASRLNLLFVLSAFTLMKILIIYFFVVLQLVPCGSLYLGLDTETFWVILPQSLNSSLSSQTQKGSYQYTLKILMIFCYMLPFFWKEFCCLEMIWSLTQSSL